MMEWGRAEGDAADREGCGKRGGKRGVARGGAVSDYRFNWPKIKLGELFLPRLLIT